MGVTPLILGSGRAGHAIAESFSCLGTIQPELEIRPAVWLKRGTDLMGIPARHENPILCIATPHALHADSIIKADQAGFSAILSEKPSCVDLAQLEKLKAVQTPTAILHVYRQTWGVQTLKSMLDQGEFGELVCIEGRYWQSSTAERALQGKSVGSTSWKNDRTLSGPSDTFLDVGTHWLDASSFLIGSAPSQIKGWRSYVNSETDHRDSHVHLDLKYPGGQRAFASISKTVHGASNHFELNLIGSKLSATWTFLDPDRIHIGEGRNLRVITRKNNDLGSRHAAFHGLGWLEGYIEIIRQLVEEVRLGQKKTYPALAENLKLMESALKTHWQD